MSRTPTRPNEQHTTDPDNPGRPIILDHQAGLAYIQEPGYGGAPGHWAILPGLYTRWAKTRITPNAAQASNA